jgi:hypothetical protein
MLVYGKLLAASSTKMRFFLVSLVVRLVTLQRTEFVATDFHKCRRRLKLNTALLANSINWGNLRWAFRIAEQIVIAGGEIAVLCCKQFSNGDTLNDHKVKRRLGVFIPRPLKVNVAMAVVTKRRPMLRLAGNEVVGRSVISPSIHAANDRVYAGVESRSS